MIERRLAAILAADVAGYSRLMGADEEGVLAALRALREELFDPAITRHRGRIVKLMGDGVLVEFASVVDAVTCGAEVQRALAERNAGVARDKRLELRIGINLGDVMIDGDDLYGEGVPGKEQKLAEIEALLENAEIAVRPLAWRPSIWPGALDAHRERGQPALLEFATSKEAAVSKFKYGGRDSEDVSPTAAPGRASGC